MGSFIGWALSGAPVATRIGDADEDVAVAQDQLHATEVERVGIPGVNGEPVPFEGSGNVAAHSRCFQGNFIDRHLLFRRGLSVPGQGRSCKVKRGQNCRLTTLPARLVRVPVGAENSIAGLSR